MDSPFWASSPLARASLTLLVEHLNGELVAAAAHGEPFSLLILAPEPCPDPVRERLLPELISQVCADGEVSVGAAGELILVWCARPASEGAALAERIGAHFQGRFAVQVTAGVCDLASSAGSTVQALFSGAQRALFRAQSLGGTQVSIQTTSASGGDPSVFEEQLELDCPSSGRRVECVIERAGLECDGVAVTACSTFADPHAVVCDGRCLRYVNAFRRPVSPPPHSLGAPMTTVSEPLISA